MFVYLYFDVHHVAKCNWTNVALNWLCILVVWSQIDLSCGVVTVFDRIRIAIECCIERKLSDLKMCSEGGSGVWPQSIWMHGRIFVIGICPFPMADWFCVGYVRILDMGNGYKYSKTRNWWNFFCNFIRMIPREMYMSAPTNIMFRHQKSHHRSNSYHH